MENTFHLSPEDVTGNFFQPYDCSNTLTMKKLVEDLSCESLYSHSVVKEYFYYSGYTGSTGPRGINGGICFYITYLQDGFKSNHTFGLNPDFHLVRGFTYYFKVNTKGHLFWISTDTVNHPYSPVINNGIENGCITFTVPLDSPELLYYVSDSIYGMIYISDAGGGPTGPTGIQGPDGGPPGPTGPTGPIGTIIPVISPTFLSLYNTAKQSVLQGMPIIFEKASSQIGMINFIYNSSAIFISKPGFYLFHMTIYPIEGCQFAIYKNVTDIIPESVVGIISGSSQIVNSFISEITDSDIVNTSCKIEVINTTGYVPSVTLYDASSLGYTLPHINASLNVMLLK